MPPLDLFSSIFFSFYKETVERTHYVTESGQIGNLYIPNMHQRELIYIARECERELLPRLFRYNMTHDSENYLLVLQVSL